MAAADDLSGLIVLPSECLTCETAFPVVVFIKLSDENKNP